MQTCMTRTFWEGLLNRSHLNQEHKELDLVWQILRAQIQQVKIRKLIPQGTTSEKELQLMVAQHTIHLLIVKFFWVPPLCSVSCDTVVTDLWLHQKHFVSNQYVADDPSFVVI